MCLNVLKNATSGMRARDKAEFFIKLSVVRAKKRIKLWVAQDGRCHYCDADTILPKQGCVNSGGLIATLDHIITQSSGGTDSTNNMVIACSTCNGNRGEMDYQTYYDLKKTPGAWKEYCAQIAREKAERDEGRRQDSAIRHAALVQRQQEESLAARSARQLEGDARHKRHQLIQQQAGHNGVRLLAAWINRANFKPRKDGHGWIAIQDSSSMEAHPWVDLTGDTEFYINN